MKPLPARTLYKLIALTALAMSTSACSSQPDLPSVSGTTTAPRDLQQVAKDYLACMTAADLPMELGPNLQGEMIMVKFTDGHDAAWVNPDGTSM